MGVFVVAVMAGCGDDDPDTVDAAQIEQQIEQDLSSATTQIKSVSCPDDVESETGAKFTCSAKLSGGGSAKVEVTEDGPEPVHYSFKPGTVELAGSTVDKDWSRTWPQAASRTRRSTAPIPSRSRPGTTVTCPVGGAQGGAATDQLPVHRRLGLDRRVVASRPGLKRSSSVNGKELRVRDTLKFEDRDGHELLKIQERKLRVRDTMAIERDGDKVGETVRKKLITPLRERFKVELADGGEYDGQGQHRRPRVHLRARRP